MRVRHILASTAAATVALSGLAAFPAEAATTPAKISGVKAVAGPKVGEITVTWKQSGAHTTGYRVETGLTTFTNSGNGRGKKVFSFPGKRQSLTLSASQVAAAGAAPATGNHLYFRLTAVNTKGAGTATRSYPYLNAGKAKAVTPSAGGTDVRVASFNVRTARGSGRSWLSRATDVAREIKSRNPGVVAVQELGPGRADGVVGKLNGKIRQTESLEKALSSVGAGKYQLVRTTAYVKPGTNHGTQGTRILFDTTRYSLVSDCPETTGGSGYNSSCSMNMPKLSSDSESRRRSAAWAELKDKSTGEKFFVVSVHLDERHSGNASKEKKYDALRRSQVKAVYNRVSSIAGGQEIIMAGDLNSWQNKAVSNAPHDFLVGMGFYDTAAAKTTVNLQYTTMNHFKRTLTPATHGYGVRLDAVLVKGAKGAERFENVMNRVDGSRPSDHNMVVSDVVL